MELILALFVGILCGFLGTFSGGGLPKFLRRFMVPILTAIAAILVTGNFWLLFLLLRIPVFHLGYGIPDAYNIDQGSGLGRFWLKYFEGKLLPATIAVRASIALAETLACCVLLFTNVSLWFIFLSLLFVAVHVIFGAIVEREGSFTLFGRKFLWEEFYIYGINSFAIVLYASILCR